jgi:hypothetical protein
MPIGWEMAGLSIIAVVLLAIAAWVLIQYRTTPEERERQRRLTVGRRGRLVDGVITDANATTLFYSYAVGGVGYAASQDVGGLRKLLPADPERFIGPVTIKYAMQNPANSIVVCEDWSGLRFSSRESRGGPE